MIDFKKIELNDKRWMDPLIEVADMRGCHQNFTNIFAWSENYNYRIAKIHDYLVVKGGKCLADPYYFYPAGQSDLKVVLEAMKQDARDCKHKFRLAGLSPDNVDELKSLFPSSFSYQENRSDFDYVYLLDKLVTLAGKKLQAKRNHINRFKENNWAFELISTANLAECWEMNVKWCLDHDSQDEDQLAKENCAVSRCFDNFSALELEGGLLRVDGKVIAYTMGEILNSDTYVVHIEKAFGEIQGAYQMINREFASLVQKRYPQIVYVNREEDMGLDGLRKAKLSYRPEMMEEKFLAEYISV